MKHIQIFICLITWPTITIYCCLIWIFRHIFMLLWFFHGSWIYDFFREFSLLFSTNPTRWIFFGEKAILEESYEPSLGKLHWAANFYTHIAPSYRDDIVYGRPLIKLQRFLNVDYDIWNLVKELKIGIKVHIFWEGHNNMPKSQNFFWRYKVISNKIWRLRQILVAFSKYMNFT